MKQFLFFIFSVMCLIGVVSFKPLISRDTNGVSVIQKGKETIIKNGDELNLNKNKFAIRFSSPAYNSASEKYYAARLAVFMEKDKQEWTAINANTSTQNTPCFESGSGMAPDASGFYESLMFNNAGHHYLYYENKKDRRVNLLSQDGNVLRLEFSVNKLFLNNKDVKLKKAEVNTLYFAIFIDGNLNEFIDEGELTKLAVKFE